MVKSYGHYKVKELPGIKKSKNNDTYFTEIPTLDKIAKYEEYQRIVNEAVKLKSLLKTKSTSLAKVNTAYQKYLMDNPYKERKKELTEEVDNLRNELMKVIPDRFGGN